LPLAAAEESTVSVVKEDIKNKPFLVYEGHGLTQEQATKLYNELFSFFITQRNDLLQAKRFIELSVAYAEKSITMGLVNHAYKMLIIAHDVVITSGIFNAELEVQDGVFIIPVLMAKCAMAETDAFAGFKVATTAREEALLYLKKSKDCDPEALRLLDRHLKCMAGKYIMEQEDSLSEREGLLKCLPGIGKRQELRNILAKENIRELGEFYLWQYDYENADRVFLLGQTRGDPIAASHRIICLMHKNNYPQAEKLILAGYKSGVFDAFFNSAMALLIWNKGAKDFGGAKETITTIQRNLDLNKAADAKHTTAKDAEGVHLLHQWYLSLEKMKVYATEQNMIAAENEALLLDKIMRHWTLRAMSSTFEKERLRYRQIIESTPFDIGYITGQTKLLADNLVLYKGLVADSMLRKAPNTDSKPFLDKGYPPDLALDLARLSDNVMASRPEGLDAIDSQTVLRDLPRETILVDFAKCCGLNDRAFNEEEYVAVIYDKTKQPNIRIVKIGDAKQIESKVAELLALVEASAEDPHLEEVASGLYINIVAPWFISNEHAGREVIICPDSFLSFVNFAALPDAQGVFLGEKASITYISAARDLIPKTALRTPQRRVGKLQARVFVDPDYKAPWTARLKALFVSRRNAVLHPLPQSRLEAGAVARSFEGAQKEIKTYVGMEATEENVRDSQECTLIHMGTHGFYNNQATENPMRSNGLAFAGAYETINKNSSGEYTDNPHDGILTAEEISRMDLSSCWLVSVSACQSGMGRSYEGEGVLGIRRGFNHAGVANLLLCLWPVGDKEARIFIEQFYQYLGQGVAIKKAYTQTMAELLRKAADEKGIAYAIRAVGPFVMNSVSKPLPNN